MSEENEGTTALAGERAQLAEERAALAAERAEIAAERLARRAEDAIEPHIRAGRLLPRQKGKAVALMTSLLASETTVSFAAPEGEGGEVTSAAADAFLDLLGECVVQVHYGELAGGQPPDGEHRQDDDAAIASKAVDLVVEARGRGEVLSPVAAVDQVRAKRGLPQS